jgi:hypothetical protein
MKQLVLTVECKKKQYENIPNEAVFNYYLNCVD